MDAKLIVNLVAILVGLFAYLGVMNTPWGKKHEGQQYFIMLVAVLLACCVGGLIKWLM